MNILVIGTTDFGGGAAKVAWEIKTTLEAAGHHVSLFVADKRSRDKSVTVIPRSQWRKIVGFLFATERLIATDWLLDTEEFKNADIVHCHNLHGRFFNLSTLEKMAAQKPVIWTLHDEWAITPHCAYTLEGEVIKNGLYVCPDIDAPPRLLWDNSKRLAKERTAFYARTKFHVVTPSLWLKERVEKTPLCTHHLYHIPNGVNTDIFSYTSQSAARAKLKLPPNKRIVLFLATAGKANTWKGWTYTEAVIKHYESDSNTLFLHVGSFTEEASTPTIEYRRHVDDPHELALYYSAADVLLFTSTAENFPLVILEAMSCGLPIVAFDVGGVKEVMIHKENGYLAGYRKTADLLAGIEWVSTRTATEREALRERSSAKIRGAYDVRQMTEQYLRLYQTLTNKT